MNDGEAEVPHGEGCGGRLCTGITSETRFQVVGGFSREKFLLQTPELLVLHQVQTVEY